MWHRRSDESNEAWEAFEKYLFGSRSYNRVATELKKSGTLIYRWAHKYGWKERAAAYDNELLEKVRNEARRDLSERYRRILADAIAFQEKASAALREKDLSKASVKSLTELFGMAKDTELAIYELLKMNEPARDMEIKIIDE